MLITVTVQLGKDQMLAYTPDAAATQVLDALGGKADQDTCVVSVIAASEPGQAGVPPPVPQAL